MTPRLKFRPNGEWRFVLWGTLAGLIIGAILTDYLARGAP